MSATETQASTAEATTPARRRRLAKRWQLVTTVMVVLAGVVAVVLVDLFGGKGAAGGAVRDNGSPTSLATVARGSLRSQFSASGTLQYASSGGSLYSVVNQEGGTFSRLPSVGQVVSRGQVLYRVSNDPVILLYGSTPVYRSLTQGDTGPDVQELNRNLVALGYATSTDFNGASDYFSAETADALERLQGRLGETQTGSLNEGQALFMSGRIRIAMVRVLPGVNAIRGVPIAQATSTSRDVVVDLDASEQTEVKVSDQAQITLPTGHTTTGIVSAIGTAASAGSSSPTLPVYIRLEHPQAAGTLNQAPVQVEITTATIKDALVVPVDALLARSGSEYAVETVDARGVHRLVTVALGTFDDAAGTVQVTGKLRAGQRVVVPRL